MSNIRLANYHVETQKNTLRKSHHREGRSTTYIPETRRNDSENIIKSRHFSVISERLIIRSYIRLANHHEETQKKYAKEKPERKVQLRLSQKHVGKISKT